MNSPSYCPMSGHLCSNDCPWWRTERNCCAVLDISASLSRLSAAAAALAESAAQDGGEETGE